MSCFNNSEVIRVCAKLQSADVKFSDCYDIHDVHCHMSDIRCQGRECRKALKFIFLQC